MNVFKQIALITILASLSVFTACGDTEDTTENNHAHHNNHNHGGHVSDTVHPPGLATSDHGHFSVLAEHAPAAPVAGAGQLTLTITDAHDDTPVTGLTLTVTPWMPAHGHGSNKTPVVTEKSDGVYEVTDLVYTMPGDWEARVAIHNSHHDDTIAFGFNVQ